jgi:hypothetical protein
MTCKNELVQPQIRSYAFPMANPELVQALEYILNRSDEPSIEVLAEAVVRRRRELALFGSTASVPNPQKLAKELSGQVNAGVGATIDGVKKSVRDMAGRIIREHAPELTDAQVGELLNEWVPDRGSQTGRPVKPPEDMMISMIEQFVSFSRGTMLKSLDETLRETLGTWPERYWNSFPAAVRRLITDFLKDKISEREFYSKIGIAVEVGA